MTALVYDAGALIAAARDNRRMWLLHRRALDRGIEPIVPATVLAQVRRGPATRGLAGLLVPCQVVALDRRAAELVGDLLGPAADIEYLAAVARADAKGRFGRLRVATISI